MEGKMSLFDELRQQAGMGGPAGVLAQELINIRQQYEAGQLTREEYDFLISEIASVRAQQELASDEIACRWIVAAAQTMLSLV
jgi:hypothetical protein